MAIATVILLITTFGIIESGHGFYAYASIANAARDATRYAIVRGSACTSWATACPASATDVTNFVKSQTPPGIDPSRMTVTTTWVPNHNPGSAVKVTVQYRFSFTLAFIKVSDATISSSSQMVIWE
jgi:Flp pilus assembly protein TadG